MKILLAFEQEHVPAKCPWWKKTLEWCIKRCSSNVLLSFTTNERDLLRPCLSWKHQSVLQDTIYGNHFTKLDVLLSRNRNAALWKLKVVETYIDIYETPNDITLPRSISGRFLASVKHGLLDASSSAAKCPASIKCVAFNTARWLTQMK